MKRLCSMCRQSFDESEFYQVNGRFNTYCRNCQRTYQREYKRYYRTLEKTKKYCHEYYLRRKNENM